MFQKRRFLAALLVIGAVLSGGSRLLAADAVLAPSPLSNGEVARLYAPQDGGPTAVSILRMASWRQRLYVALRALNGDERIDAWDLSNLEAPRRIDSISFGNIANNGVRLLPVALVAGENELLVQTSEGLNLYRHNADGHLSLERSFQLVTGLGAHQMGQLSLSGRFASHQQQVIPNGEINPAALDAVHQEVVIDLSNLNDPIQLWSSGGRGSVVIQTPVNATFNGEPASLSYDEDHAQLIRLETQLRAHLDDFWAPKLDRVFVEGSLDASLGALIRAAVERLNLPAVQSRSVRLYADGVALGAFSLGELIAQRHAAGERLIDILQGYGIDPDDSLNLAFEKLVSRGFDENLDATVGTELYSGLLKSWLKGLVPWGADVQRVADLQGQVAAALNADLTAESLVSYLTLKIISPLLGNPDFMSWTLQDLVNALADSAIGETIDLTLQGVGGFGSVNAVLGALDDLLDVVNLLPGIDVHLPDCAHFPETTRELLDMALYSWNEPYSGEFPDALADGVLDPRGLAWFELLKYYLYLNGETDFGRSIRDLEAQVRSMQTALAGQMAAHLSGALTAVADVQMSLDDAFDRFSASLSGRPLIGRLVARALVDALSVSGAVDGQLTVREALDRWGIQVGNRFGVEGTIGDLEAALTAHAAADVPLDSIYTAAAANPSALFGAGLEQELRAQIQAAFGVSNLDMPLRAALEPFLAFHMDLHGIVGDSLDQMFHQFLLDGPSLPGFLTQLPRAFDGDCLAQWMVSLQIISVATSVLDGGATAAALELSLQAGYESAIDFAVRAMLGVMIDEVIGTWGGSESHWIAAKMAPHVSTFRVFEPAADATRRIAGGFVWQDRVGFVVETRFESDWFGARRAELVMFHPDAPESTRVTYDLGRWERINFVQAAGGALAVGGNLFMTEQEAFASGRMLLVDLNSEPLRAEGIHGEGYLPLSSATLMAPVFNDSHLAFVTGNQISILRNPASSSPVEEAPAHPPQIISISDPARLAVPAGIRLEVQSVGTAPLHYRWFRDGQPLENGDRPVFDEFAERSASYSVQVTNQIGSVTSGAIAVEVVEPADLEIVEEPHHRAVFTGQDAEFHVEARGAGTLRFQWWFEDRAIPGATNSDLTIRAADGRNAGRYRAIVSNDGGAVATSAARLIVIGAHPPRLLNFEPRQQLVYGGRSSLVVQAIGLLPLQYQWFKRGQLVPSANESQFVITQVGYTDAADYQVEILSPGGLLKTPPIAIQLVTGLSLSVNANHDGTFVLRLNGGRDGDRYDIEASEDLAGWEVLETRTDLGSELEVPLPVTSLRKFFRVRISPR